MFQPKYFVGDQDLFQSKFKKNTTQNHFFPIKITYGLHNEHFKGTESSKYIKQE